MAIHAAQSHLTLTGADGPIGADQLQYLSWVRDGGEHGLASNLYELVPNPHVFLQPMFAISSLLWRIGLPMTLAYWLWKPVAVWILLAGAVAWAGRFFPDSRGARLSALLLSLSLFAPVSAIALWGSVGSAARQAQLQHFAGEVFPAGLLWGYLPSAVAVGLTPLVLLAVERAMTHSGSEAGRASRARSPLSLRGGARRPILIAGAGAAVIAWMHPWQGLTLILVLCGLAVWNRGRGWRVFAVPVIAAALPAAYYEVLAHTVSAWRLASRNEVSPHLPAAVLLLGLGPLLAIAAPGLRRPGPKPAERALILWIPAVLVGYFALSSYPDHVLEGLSFPLGVFAVRGALRLLPRLRGDWGAWRRRALVATGMLGVAALTVPGMVWEARAFRNVAGQRVSELYLTRPEARAMSWLASSHAARGGVLTDLLLGIAVPAQTGHPVWFGHQYWSQDFQARARATAALLDDRMSAGAARALVRSSGASFVLADCGEGRRLATELQPIIRAVHSFGCARIYAVN
jgi:hypothetical protein